MLRILIAEDNRVNQLVLLKILDRLNYANVDVVYDGKQACEQELRKPYDIILMDVQMPNMDGIDACKEILSRRSNYPKPKIVFITAHVTGVQEPLCKDAGGADFLPKPVSMSDVDDCLRRNMPALPALSLPNNETPVDNKTAKTPCVLVAEDNKINQKVLLKILDRLCCAAVDVADDGKQACDKERGKAYNLILMDMQMPIMDGISACREILGRPSDHPKPKIVFVTAHVLDEYKTECETAGGVDFVSKPVNIGAIESCLRRHLSFSIVPPTITPMNGTELPVVETETKLQILIAEDNKINQKVLMKILDRLEYKAVDVVENGQQACDKEGRSAYDVILMDVQMPIMDGITACREILGRQSSNPKPQIVFVTAHVSDEYKAACREAGGVDFFSKPVDMVDLGNCLRRLATTMRVERDPYTR